MSDPVPSPPQPSPRPNPPLPDPVPSPAPTRPPAGPSAGGGVRGLQPAPLPPPAGPAPSPPPGVALATFADFQKLRLRTAVVLEARPHPKADRLVILKIQVGDREKQIIAGIRPFYSPEVLAGRTLIVVDNLEAARLRGETSEGMLLAVRLPDGGIRLLTTDGPAPSGLEVS